MTVVRHMSANSRGGLSYGGTRAKKSLAWYSNVNAALENWQRYVQPHAADAYAYEPAGAPFLQNKPQGVHELEYF